MEELVERMTAGKQGAQLFKQELLSKGRHEKTRQNHTQPSTTHTHTNTHTNAHNHL